METHNNVVSCASYPSLLVRLCCFCSLYSICDGGNDDFYDGNNVMMNLDLRTSTLSDILQLTPLKISSFAHFPPICVTLSRFESVGGKFSNHFCAVSCLFETSALACF